MLNRKILIVMGDPELRQLLVDFCTALAIATMTAENVAGASAILQQTAVSEVIADGLHGEWQDLARLVRQQADPIPMTLWAADEQDRHQAERMGVRFVDQNSFSLLALVKAQAETEGRVQQ